MIKNCSIEIKGGGQTTKQYLESIELELDQLWRALGDLNVEVI